MGACRDATTICLHRWGQAKRRPLDWSWVIVDALTQPAKPTTGFQDVAADTVLVLEGRQRPPTLPWLDPRNKFEGRQAHHWDGGCCSDGDLAAPAAVVLCLSKDGRNRHDDQPSQ